MRLLIVMLSLLVALPAISETQRVEGLAFDRVVVMGNVSVEISKGETAELLLRGDEDQLNLEPFYLRDSTLVLGKSKKNSRAEFSAVKFKLTVVELKHLQLSGSGEVFVKPLQTPELYVSVDGSGDIKFFGLGGGEITLHLNGSGSAQIAALNAEEFNAVLSGSGDIDIGTISTKRTKVSLKGAGDVSVKEPSVVEELEFNVIGSGDIDFTPVDSTEVEVNIVGSGDVSVGRIEKLLDASVIGSGDVYYGGDPDVDFSNLGSGDLQCRDDH